MTANPPQYFSAFKALNYLEGKKRKVGTVELSAHLSVTLRQSQRLLVNLEKMGMVECDNASPKGYKFITYQIKEIG